MNRATIEKENAGMLKNVITQGNWSVMETFKKIYPNVFIKIMNHKFRDILIVMVKDSKEYMRETLGSQVIWFS